MNDLISRQAAIDAIEEMQMPIMRSEFPEEQFVFRGMSEALNAIKAQPSAQPSFDEWCYSCSEYDAERHCCPRWNRVIRQTLEDAQSERKVGKWIKDRLCTAIGGAYTVRRCSICESYYHDVVFTWNFCPHCGAKMEGEEHEQNRE